MIKQDAALKLIKKTTILKSPPILETRSGGIFYIRFRIDNLRVYVLNSGHMNEANKQTIKKIEMHINKILFLKKKNFLKYDNIEFFPTEIHTVLVIKNKQATNATKIASELGVTKGGAVSQTISRLEKKGGVLIKTKDPYQKNELTLTFTKFGEGMMKHYNEHAERIIELHNRYLEKFSDAEQEVIQKFLSELDDVIDEIS